MNVCGCQRRCAQDLVQNRDGGQDDVGVLRMSYRERFRAVAAADVRPGSLPAATSILMAASSSSSRVMQCVYNVPMPQDLFYNTVGLDLNGALARNLKHFAESRLFTLGPMPVQTFLDEFLQGSSLDGRPNMLPSEDAFKSVPSSGQSSADISVPLVS